MSSRERRVTIKDVAEAAEVAVSTVSHVYSGARPISAETAARVRAAADRLGYVRNSSAASLRGGQIGLLGLVLRPRNAVLGSLGGTETFTRFSGAAAAATLATGRGLVHVPDVLDSSSARFAMDGCIVMGPYEHDDVVATLQSRGIPVVCADIDPAAPDDRWSVRVDYAPAIRQILDQAVKWREDGSRVGLLCGTEANNWNISARRTLTAWATERGVGHQVMDIYEGSGAAGAERAAADLLDSPDPPSAVIVSSTRFAAGVMQAARERDLAVPVDLRVAALTDSALVREADPPVTGLDLRLEDLAERCVALLLRRIAGNAPPSKLDVIEPIVRWRASTE